MSPLPSSWAATPLLAVSELLRGVTYTKDVAASLPAPGRLPVLRANNLQGRAFNLSDLVYVPSTLVSEQQRIRAGDVVIATSSGSLSVVGKAVQSQRDMDAGFGAFCGVLRPLPALNSRFFGHYFSTEAYRARVSTMARGSNINNLKREHFESLTFPVAPIAEQQRIADKLDTVLARVDACRDRLARVAPLLKRFRQSVLFAAFSGRLTQTWRVSRAAEDINDALEELGALMQVSRKGHFQPSDFDRAPFMAPPVALGSAGQVTGGLTKNPKRGDLPLKRPFLRVANVYANELRLEDVAEIGMTQAEFQKTRLEPGDLLIVEGNGSVEQIGRVALWEGAIAECSHQNHLIRWRAGSGVNSKYVLLFLLSPQGRSQIEDVASSTTGLHTLSVAKVGAIVLPVPNVEEQLEIVRRVETLFAFADRLESRLAEAQTAVDRLTPSLLAKAFRGELVPQDPADEPAAELLKRLAAQREAAPSRTRRGRAAA